MGHLHIAMISTLMMLSVAVAEAVSVSQCQWSEGKLQVYWAAPAEGADYYEVQVANEAGGSVFAIYSTAQTHAVIDFLTAGASFWLKVRAHRVGMPSLGPGTWLEPGDEVECQTGSDVAERAGATESYETRILEVMRQSEYTYDVDYLMNHDSGDLVGDTTFIDFSSKDPDQPSFLNVTFRKSVFTLYCIEILDVFVRDTITTDGNPRFADYLSCNDNNNATDPQCQCDNFIDRSFSKAEDQTKYCHTSSGNPCAGPFSHNCTCKCTSASLEASAKYVGMMPVYFNQPELLGHWYSTPKATECLENETVGTLRTKGTKCTWKRYPEARVVRGGDALDFGWNTSTAGSFKIDVAQVRQNAGILRKLFDSQPYQKWTCESPRTMLV